MTHPYNDDVEEIKRLQTLLSFNILDTPPQEEFDSLVKLISLICDSPIAIISMIDDKRQWYKAKVGIPQNEVPRDQTFCRYTLEQDDLLEITDARKDGRVKNNPHVTSDGGIRYYAGVNIKASNGYKIGTVCVVDTKPKELNNDQKQALRLIADQTMILLEARKRNNELTQELEEILNNKVKETQRQLLQRKTEYILLLRAIRKSSAVIEFSPDGIIKSINDNFLNIIGYSREELKDNTHRLLLFEDQIEKNVEFWSSLQNGNFHAGRLKRKHKNGNAVWIQATYNPITDHNNNVTRIIKIAQDITREMEAEKAMISSKELAENLNIQKDNFIANMSHEIRTPIHAILGFTELLLEIENDNSKKSYLESVKTAGDNLLYVINDILDLSKIEAGVIMLEKEVFDLMVVVKNVFSILHLKAHQKKIDFKYNLDSVANLHIVGDKNRLSQILINLLGNAIKFTSSGSVELHIDLISLKDSSTTLQFRVTDTGIGIPEGKRKTIFDRFSQAEEDTSRTYGGTGLGLNISRQLINRMGGEISVQSNEGVGSTFSFNLPFELGNLKPAETKPETNVFAGKRRNANILLCEDNELNQRLIRAILSEKGYSIDLAENGEKGLKLAEENTYDLILMDIQMPLMDGYETTLKIRRDINTKVPIVALTANFMLSERTKCFEYGMNDYLSKPFSKEDLLKKVDQWTNVEEEEEGKSEKSISEGKQFKTILSLESLEELSGGDINFQNEMMSLFIEQGEKMFIDLQKYFMLKDIKGISSTAHKMKTSFGIIGADPGVLNDLENITQTSLISSGEENLDKLNSHLTKIYCILKTLIKRPYDQDPTS